MPPLSDIRVLDFTRHLPGPYATDLLRRLGAEIFKIEPPDGDPTRWLPPFVGDDGALFVLVNQGKKSVVVDLKSEEGRAFVHRLALQCDVVVESYRPGVAAAFQIDAATLQAINPRLVYCSISGFGAEDGRSSHDLNFVALAGLLDLQRDANGRPVLPSTQIGDMSGALFAALSILAAVVERNHTGKGRRLDISMSDATRAVMPTAESLYRGEHQRPQDFALTGALPNYDVYRTSDGKYLAVAALEPHFFAAFCGAIGHPELAARQLDAGARGEIRRVVTESIARRTRDEWERVFAGVDACVEPVLTIEEAHERFGDPLLRHPLQVNFPMQPAEAQPAGASLDEAARVAGLPEDERKTLRRAEAFQPRGRLKKLLFKAHHFFGGRS